MPYNTINRPAVYELVLNILYRLHIDAALKRDCDYRYIYIEREFVIIPSLDVDILYFEVWDR